MAAYYLMFSYPDGHVEEVEQSFSSLQGAIDYGNNLLNQVKATETFKKGSRTSGKAHFDVLLVDLDKRTTVFKSQS